MQEYKPTYEILRRHLEHNQSLNPSYRKGLEDGLEAGYNQAIDDFVERLTHKIKSEIDDCADELDWIENIAKQLRIRI